MSLLVEIVPLKEKMLRNDFKRYNKHRWCQSIKRFILPW